MTAKHRSKEERKDEIINGALECFLNKGYVNTTIDDIARQCQLSKGSIYWHFKSKDEILIQTIIVFTQMFETKLMGTINAEVSSIDKLRNGLMSFVAFQKESQGLFNLFVEFWAQSKERNEVRSYWQNLLEIFQKTITDIVQSGIDNKEIKPIDPEAFSWAVMAMLDGLGAYTVLVDNLDIEKIVDVYFHSLMNGLAY